MRRTDTMEAGSRVLLPDGIGIVQQTTDRGFQVRSVHGELVEVAFTAIQPAGAGAVHPSLEPWWSGLPEQARAGALAKLEIVQLVTTGYREGHVALARDDEPSWPFSDPGQSEARRIEAAARLVQQQNSANPTVAKRIAYGDLATVPGSASSIKRWVAQWRREGIRALVDQRAARRTPDSDRVDPEYRAVAEELVAGFTGGRSAVTKVEIDRQIRMELARRGLTVRTPQRATERFVSELVDAAGATPRAQHSHHLREVAGHSQVMAVRPGQIVAVDATRCNNLVVDPYDGTPRSVEILTAIDVASRVVLACRVCPMSANSNDLRYLLYDILREFHTVVDGASINDWRWAGVPETISLTDATLRVKGPGRASLTIRGRPLTGVHINPSVWPDGFRVDRGSINLSAQTRLVLADLGIDLLPNRGGKSNDNAHIERWWETLEGALQGIPGYKGRNPSERGTLVADEPLMTWEGLQAYLHWWIATTYHRRSHSNLHLPDDPRGPHVTPLEMFDALQGAAGRIDVAQHPDLLYQLLDVVWLTPGHAGVEHRGLTYSADILTAEGATYTGRFRPIDRAMPFFVDPHDEGQIWYQDGNNTVHEVPWTGRDRTRVPMTSKVVDRGRAIIRSRHGRNLGARAIDQELIAYLVNLENSTKAADRRALFAASIRTASSQFEHATAAAAASIQPSTPTALIEQHKSESGDQVWDDYIDLDEAKADQ